MYKYLLWSLKLGIIINLFLFFKTLSEPFASVDFYLLAPAQLLFVISAYRCLFPNNYSKKIVLHDTFFSSIFLTRFLVTFVEIAYIYQFSYVIRLINDDQFLIVDILTWIMVLQVSISQFFVWSAILLNEENLYYYEELGWFVIFSINTFLSIFLYLFAEVHSAQIILLIISIIFGLLYLPWQIIHLRMIKKRVKQMSQTEGKLPKFKSEIFYKGLSESFYTRIKRTDYDSWGGWVGMTWMYNYWIILIPGWMFYIVYIFSI
jgi:hypothetical protein